MKVLSVLSGVIASALIAEAAHAFETGGRLTSPDTNVVAWWTLSSAVKVRPHDAPPANTTQSVQIRSAKNERECVQIILQSAKPLKRLRVNPPALHGPGEHSIPAANMEMLQAVYLNVGTPTDRSTTAGHWPDPLVPLTGLADLGAGTNHAIWVRVFVPPNAAAGTYKGTLEMSAQDWSANIPLELTVYNFALPDEMTCRTSFGFSPGEVFRYHAIKTDQDKRAVLNKYWANLAAHHISPYDPAPLDPIKVSWPDVKPPRGQWVDWTNLRLATNEFHSGNSCLVINDDLPGANLVVGYEPLLQIPNAGLRIRGWYRTPIPGHRFTVSLNHYDSGKKWMSGLNRDMVMSGSGHWQQFDETITNFPPRSAWVRFNVIGTVWTDPGEKIGIVWLDDLSVTDLTSGKELISGGDFEIRRRTELVAPASQLRPQLDFSAWDRAMAEALDQHHFNSFTVDVPGLGGGTFHELVRGNLQGFTEDDPEYALLLSSYCQQLQDHLKAKNWISKSYVYWFDEPSADQYPFLQNGFNKLKQYCPDITRMITKHPEPGLFGGPNLWCAISDQYDHAAANERRKFGERFWWYVCTGPKAPYAGLFLDHAAPEMRIWLWQTFQRDITGILVWQINYWNSSTAYPDPGKPQNPYEDPMSWTVGYGTPKGTRLPWGNGDGRFIYPPLSAANADATSPVLDGPVDSIRWEHLRDGIEDYEYLVILRERLKNKAGLSPEDIRRFQALLTVPETITRSMTEFTPDGAPIEHHRDQVARAIEQL